MSWETLFMHIWLAMWALAGEIFGVRQSLHLFAFFFTFYTVAFLHTRLEIPIPYFLQRMLWLFFAPGWGLETREL